MNFFAQIFVLSRGPLQVVPTLAPPDEMIANNTVNRK